MANDQLTPFPETAPMVRAAGQTARGFALAAAVGLASLGCVGAPMPADAGFTSDSGRGSTDGAVPLDALAPMPPPSDAGPPDAGADLTDAGTDAGAPDANLPDANLPDAGFDSGVIAPMPPPMPPPPMPAS